MEKNFKLYMAQSGRPVQLEKEHNQSVLQKWKDLDLYKSVNEQLKSDKKPFVFVDGPPYANGGAHLGHVLNKVWKDLTVKSQWFLGNEVQWTPGWDCHGLPLELQVDKKHQTASVEDKKKYCKNLALRSLSLQRKDFQSLGVHADWNNPYLTLSPTMRKASWKTLRSMYEQDLLQYKMWPVHHCPACGSSLAEAELEYENKDRLELYFKYSLGDNLFALVWTTTPWTLPMNQALAFNKNFTYEVWESAEDKVLVDASASEEVKNMMLEKGYQVKEEVSGEFLNNKQGFAPLSGKSTPVLHGEFVLDGQTGFVHVAGAHGVEDYELVVQHNLEPLNLLDKYGRYLEQDGLDNDFWGKKNTSVNELVVQKLNNSLMKAVNAKVETAHCWRHKTKVYYQATWQVFLNLDDLKPRVESMLNNGSLSDVVRENLKNMLLSRSHWCLSRQRYWGTELNLLVDKNTQKLSPLTAKYLELYSLGKESEAEQLLSENNNLYPVKDVLDVWFDSGNVVFGLGNELGFEQADMVLEGKDQYRGWFQSLLWMQAVHYNKLPYKNVLVHGFVLDEKKMKFSKSSGNGLTAKQAVNLYGADMLRLWSAMQEENTDAVFSEKKMNEAKTYYQRLRLSLRFLSSNAYQKSFAEHQKTLSLLLKEDKFDFYKFALEKTNECVAEYSQSLESFEYKKALQTLYFFCDKFLSQYVFEVMKQPLYLKGEDTLEKQMVQSCAYELYYQLVKMVAVFCPFVAEEFLEQSTLSNDFESVFLLPKTKSEYAPKYNWNFAMELRKLMNTKLEPMQQQKLVKGSNQLHCVFTFDNSKVGDWNNLNQVMSSQYWLGTSLATMSVGEELSVELFNLSLNEDYHKCPRCWNYDKKDNFTEEVCSHCEKDA
jgi:isoleucyl-tRNA synthetase